MLAHIYHAQVFDFQVNQLFGCPSQSVLSSFSNADRVTEAQGLSPSSACLIVGYGSLTVDTMMTTSFVWTFFSLSNTFQILTDTASTEMVKSMGAMSMAIGPLLAVVIFKYGGRGGS